MRMNAAKKTQGKKKIEMEFIQDFNTRRSTFRKRVDGIFKKAGELEKLCGAIVELRVILDEPRGKKYDYHYSTQSQALNNLPPKRGRDSDETVAANDDMNAAAAAAATMLPSFEGYTSMEAPDFSTSSSVSSSAPSSPSSCENFAEQPGATEFPVAVENNQDMEMERLFDILMSDDQANEQTTPFDFEDLFANFEFVE